MNRRIRIQRLAPQDREEWQKLYYRHKEQRPRRRLTALKAVWDGQTLAEVALSRNYGLQVAGIRRAGLRIPNPRGEEKLFTGDELLVLGSPDQISAFKASIRNEGGARPYPQQE